MQECCFHARKSLVQEIAEGLKVRGYPVPDSVYHNHSEIIGVVFRTIDRLQPHDQLPFLEGDQVELVVDDYEFVKSSPNQIRDEFCSLPKGERGVVISVGGTGCYVEFPYIDKHHPEAEPITWVESHEIRKVDQNG